MSYTRKTNHIFFRYFLDSGSLSGVEATKYLNVLFDSAPTFSSHVSQHTRRALRSRGAVCRFSRDIRSPNSFINLFIAVSISQVEYASVFLFIYSFTLKALTGVT